MRKNIYTLIACLFVLFPTRGLAEKVIVSIWDGGAYDIIKSLYDSGQLPNADVWQLPQSPKAQPC